MIFERTGAQSAHSEIRPRQNDIQRERSGGRVPQLDSLPLPAQLLLVRTRRGRSAGTGEQPVARLGPHVRGPLDLRAPHADLPRLRPPSASRRRFLRIPMIRTSAAQPDFLILEISLKTVKTIPFKLL